MKKIIMIFAMIFTACLAFAQNSGLKLEFSAADLNGNAVTDEIFSKNKLTMVNIWGTFCGPCIREMPELGELSREYKSKGFAIVGIVSDSVGAGGKILEQQKNDADEIVALTKADYTHIVPSLDMVKTLLMGIQYVPTTIFVDSEGNQVGDILVGSRSKSQWKKVIDSLLKSMN